MPGDFGTPSILGCSGSVLFSMVQYGSVVDISIGWKVLPFAGAASRSKRAKSAGWLSRKEWTDEQLQQFERRGWRQRLSGLLKVNIRSQPEPCEHFRKGHFLIFLWCSC
jgi:hypothetical protein